MLPIPNIPARNSVNYFLQTGNYTLIAQNCEYEQGLICIVTGFMYDEAWICESADDVEILQSKSGGKIWMIDKTKTHCTI